MFVHKLNDDFLINKYKTLNKINVFTELEF